MDAKGGELPIVAHRKNNCEWLITMKAADWFEIYREWEAGKEDDPLQKLKRISDVWNELTDIEKNHHRDIFKM